MSSGKRRQSLRGTDRLGQDSLAEFRPEATGGYQVHLAAKKGLEALLHLEEVEEADRPVKFHEEVDVAPRSSLVAGHRPKQRQTPNPEIAELGVVEGDDFESLGATHDQHHRRMVRGRNHRGKAGYPLGPFTIFFLLFFLAFFLVAPLGPFTIFGTFAVPAGRWQTASTLWPDGSKTKAP